MQAAIGSVCWRNDKTSFTASETLIVIGMKPESGHIPDESHDPVTVFRDAADRGHLRCRDKRLPGLRLGVGAAAHDAAGGERLHSAGAESSQLSLILAPCLHKI